MRKWAKEHGLLLANIGLFVVFFGGMILSGAAAYSEGQAAHGQPGVSVLEYLSTGDFVEATFENWESEFLQMAMYVVLTVFLFQKGSSESKPIGKSAPQDEDPRDARIEEQQSHGQPTVTMLGYLGTSRLWFESFQNWQSEFLASQSWWAHPCISAKRALPSPSPSPSRTTKQARERTEHPSPSGWPEFPASRTEQ